jgi:uncharacterized membrane protein
VSTNTQPSRRLDFIDAHRGFAVLLMLLMHTADGWLRPELKRGAAWDTIRALGGIGAPTFLLLAGVSVALGWGAAAAQGRGEGVLARRSELARGLQLVVLGYALRVQMWMLDAAGYRLAEGWAAAIPLAAGFVATYVGLDAWARGLRSARWLGIFAAAAALIGYALVAAFIPDRFGRLLRVDVLQAIGASLVVLATLRTALQRHPALGLGLAAVVALLTPLVRDTMPGPLPAAIAGYVAQWDLPPGQRLPTLFPLFPWLTYALVGATVGLHVGRVQRRDGGGARLTLLLAAASLGVVLIAYEPLPPARFLMTHWPWLQSLLRVAYRAGVVMLLGGLAVLLAHPRVPRPIRGVPIVFGRASLPIYWIHLQFAFGAAASSIVRKLSFDAWAIGLAVLTLAMIPVALLWLRLRAWLRGSSGGRRGRTIRADRAALTRA